MKKLFIALLFFPFVCIATELAPWFGVDKLFEIRPGFAYQTYSHINVNGASLKKHSNDLFYHVSVSMSPTPSWSFELEGLASNTTYKGMGLDSASLTGRYLLMDDVVGMCPISMAVGTTFTQATRRSLTDFSSFHHSTTEAEFHLSIGKEFSCKSFWVSRVWGLVGYGISYRYSPWLHARLEWDKNFCDQFRIGVFSEGLLGLGHSPFPFVDPFIGYGPLEHRSLDVGVFIEYKALKLAYTTRALSRNFPSHQHLIVLSVYIPFNLNYLPFKVSY